VSGNKWRAPAAPDTDWKQVLSLLCSSGLSESRDVKATHYHEGFAVNLVPGPSSFCIKLTEEQYLWLRESLDGTATSRA
jgi:hypothetical protein